MKGSVSEGRERVSVEPSLDTARDQLRAALHEVIMRLPADSDSARRLRRVADGIETLMRVADATQQRLRSLLDAMPDAVTVHDAQGRILDANLTAAQVYGYALEQLKRMDVLDLNPDLSPQHMEQVVDTAKLGQTVTIETTNVHGDGHRFPVEVHSNVYREGEDLRIVAIARDVSLRHQAEFALRSSEERYRRLLDAVDQGILVQDWHSRIVSANGAAARFLGVSVEQLLRDGIDPAVWTAVDDQGRPLGVSDLPGARALRTGEVISSTLIGLSTKHFHGFRWFSVTSVPQFLQGADRPFQVISVFGDVTDLKRQSEQFEQTQSLAHIGGWEMTMPGRHMHWSAEIYRLLEVARDAFPDWQTLMDCFAPGDAARLRAAVDRALAEREPFDLELQLGPRMLRRWVRVIGHPRVHAGRAQTVTGTIQDITLRRTQEEQLRRQALTDQLTGLANRGALLRALGDALDRAQPGQGPALLYVDLDRFKVINDLLGHGAGDGLLIAAAQRLKDVAGGDALVARFGGDEFMVLLPWSEDPSLPEQLAERITEGFSRPFEYAAEEFTITTSVGVAHYPEDGATIQQLINHADAAMFEAKRRGRNKWQHFSPQLARSLTDRLLIETQLRRALDNNEFYLAFQPQVDLETGGIMGAEALLRWRSRLLGEMNPGIFIAHAENTGDIVRIGAWVIREACRQMREWQQLGLNIPKIAVNVSYRQFLNESLPEVIRAALAEFELPGHALEIELTERVLVEDVPDTKQTFNELREIGVNLVIDDFGEGYSALSYLRQFPFNGLKIGHKFMHGVPENGADAAICKAIVNIAQSLGLFVIAEGVESEQQRRYLISHGARLAQGFLFSRPVSAAEILQYAQRFPAP